MNTPQIRGAFAELLPEDVRENVRRHREIPTIPLITERVIDISQGREVRLAREHLASLSADRRAELDREWNDG